MNQVWVELSTFIPYYHTGIARFDHPNRFWLTVSFHSTKPRDNNPSPSCLKGRGIMWLPVQLLKAVYPLSCTEDRRNWVAWEPPSQNRWAVMTSSTPCMGQEPTSGDTCVALIYSTSLHWCKTKWLSSDWYILWPHRDIKIENTVTPA